MTVPQGTRGYVSYFYMFVWTTSLIFARPIDAQDRQWLAPLEEIGRVEDVDGTLFGNPVLITASPTGGFVVADWADHTVGSFSSVGEKLWQFGRYGEGPGEFSDIIADLEFNALGQLMVLDRSGRITLVDSAGNLVDTESIPITGYFPPTEQILPNGYGDGEPVILSPDFEYVWVSGDRSVPSPNIYNLELSSITSHRSATNASDGEAVVFHTWSDHMILLDDSGQIRSVVRGVERIEFPDPLPVVQEGQTVGYRPDPRAAQATQSVTVTDDRIYVLFQGETRYRGRLVDTYARNGEYLGSHLLPEDVRGVKMTVVAGGVVAMIDTSLVPMVIFFAEEK